MYNKLKQNKGQAFLPPALSQLTDLKSKITMSDGKRFLFINKEIAELTKQSLVPNRLRTKVTWTLLFLCRKPMRFNQQLDLLKRNCRRLMESDDDQTTLPLVDRHHGTGCAFPR